MDGAMRAANSCSHGVVCGVTRRMLRGLVSFPLGLFGCFLGMFGLTGARF